MFNKLHHAAYRCNDARETTEFYRDVLGLKFSHALTNDYVPSIKIYAPHIHIFFEMKDGSSIAFFEVPMNGALANHDRCQHIALEVDDYDTLVANKAKLEAKGLKVVGPTDHHFCHSIYFFDPNGHRLEMTVPSITGEAFERYCADPGPDAVLDQWEQRKQEERWPLRRGQPVTSRQ